MSPCEARLEKARRLRAEGYNCAQSVIMCFSDIVGVDDETLARLTSALGAGVAAQRQICGVANAIALVIGSRHGSDPAAKIAASKEAKPIVEEFKSLFGNRITCAELKGQPDMPSCHDLVYKGVEILSHYIDKE